MTTDRLTPIAQYLVLAKLNHCFKDTHLSVLELADFIGVEQASIRRAAQNLEWLGFAKRVHGQGADLHRVYLEWQMGKVQLWEKAIRWMRTPVVRHYLVSAPENMNAFIPGGANLLSERTTGFKIDGKPHLVYKGFSQKRENNEALIHKVKPTEADYVVEFWSHPPLLPGKTEMDNLSLYLSVDPTGDRNIELNHCLVLTTFDWDGKGVYRPRTFRRTPSATAALFRR